MSERGLFPDLEPGGGARIVGSYRYVLWRRWGNGAPANFVMLNPSTGDAVVDDATIRRCVAFARSWGYDALAVTNLFALRSTDPSALRSHPDPVGPENDGHLVAQARAAAIVVCAWGHHGSLGNRAAIVADLLHSAGIPLHCLRLTGLGQPGHPLYLPSTLRPVAWPRADPQAAVS